MQIRILCIWTLLLIDLIFGIGVCWYSSGPTVPRVTHQNTAVSYCGCSMFRRAGRWPTSAPCWRVCTRRYRSRRLSFPRSSRPLECRRLSETWAPRTKQLGGEHAAVKRTTLEKTEDTLTSVREADSMCLKYFRGFKATGSIISLQTILHIYSMKWSNKKYAIKRCLISSFQPGLTKHAWLWTCCCAVFLNRPSSCVITECRQSAIGSSLDFLSATSCALVWLFHVRD